GHPYDPEAVAAAEIANRLCLLVCFTCILVDNQRLQCCAGDLPRIAPFCGAVLVENLHLVPDRFRVSEDVARIRVTRDRAQGALLTPVTDHDRDAVGTDG